MINDILILSFTVSLRTKVFVMEKRRYIHSVEGNKKKIVQLCLDLKYYYKFIRYFILKYMFIS